MTSYEGTISRKDTDRGVTLTAKVVTPNKLKADVKNYDVTVKSLPLSAYDKAMEDARIVKNYVWNTLGREEGIKNVAQSIGELIPGIGENGSVITYRLENNASYYPLTGTVGNDVGCFDSGIFMKRPGIGKKDAVGELVITATNEGKAVSLSLPITVKAQDIETFLNTSLDFDSIWDNIIRGNNPANTSTAKGYAIIENDLDITDDAEHPGVRILSASAMSEEEREDKFPGFEPGSYIKITTTVTDSLSNSIKTAIYGSNDPRVAADGELVTPPTYDIVYNHYITASGIGNDILPQAYDNGTVDSRWFKLAGLSISCSVQFCDVEGNPDTDVQAEPVTRYSDSKIKIYTKSQYFTNETAITKAYDGANFTAAFFGSSSSQTAEESNSFRTVDNDHPMSAVIGNIIEVNFNQPAFTAPVFKVPRASTKNAAIATVTFNNNHSYDIPLQFTSAVTEVRIWSDSADVSNDGETGAVVFHNTDSNLVDTLFGNIFGSATFAGAFTPGTGTNSDKWVANIDKEAAAGKAIMFVITTSTDSYSVAGGDPALQSGQQQTSAYTLFKFTELSSVEEEPNT